LAEVHLTFSLKNEEFNVTAVRLFNPSSAISSFATVIYGCAMA
jgi:hypothetical protein